MSSAEYHGHLKAYTMLCILYGRTLSRELAAGAEDTAATIAAILDRNGNSTDAAAWRGQAAMWRRKAEEVTPCAV